MAAILSPEAQIYNEVKEELTQAISGVVDGKGGFCSLGVVCEDATIKQWLAKIPAGFEKKLTTILKEYNSYFMLCKDACVATALGISNGFVDGDGNILNKNALGKNKNAKSKKRPAANTDGGSNSPAGTNAGAPVDDGFAQELHGGDNLPSANPFANDDDFNFGGESANIPGQYVEERNVEQEAMKPESPQMNSSPEQNQDLFSLISDKLMDVALKEDSLVFIKTIEQIRKARNELLNIDDTPHWNKFYNTGASGRDRGRNNDRDRPDRGGDRRDGRDRRAQSTNPVSQRTIRMDDRNAPRGGTYASFNNDNMMNRGENSRGGDREPVKPIRLDASDPEEVEERRILIVREVAVLLRRSPDRQLPLEEILQKVTGFKHLSAGVCRSPQEFFNYRTVKPLMSLNNGTVQLVVDNRVVQEVVDGAAKTFNKYKDQMPHLFPPGTGGGGGGASRGNRGGANRGRDGNMGGPRGGVGSFGGHTQRIGPPGGMRGGDNNRLGGRGGDEKRRRVM
ncbi:unnamed protein product [Amoebophrya sp. A120]|nr:unnamed protein product [Amoebophrya sp. A120]|eukprot:GSA120T00014769001.1